MKNTKDSIYSKLAMQKELESSIDCVYYYAFFSPSMVNRHRYSDQIYDRVISVCMMMFLHV